MVSVLFLSLFCLAVFALFDVGGNVNAWVMEFDLILFTLLPTVEVYDRCCKKDLISIADFFNISIPKEVSKQVIKEELFGELVEAGILAASDGAVGKESETAETAGFDSVLNIDSKDSGSDAVLAIKLKELDIELKRQECEAQRIRL